MMTEETSTMLVPDINPNAGRVERMTELVINLHLVRAKAESYGRRVNEMLVIALNDGEDPVVLRESTGLTFDEMLDAENDAFRARLNDSARLRLLRHIDEKPQYGQVGDGSRGSRGMLSGFQKPFLRG